MKLALFTLILAMVSFLIFSCSRRSNFSSTTVGSVDDIENNVEQLMKSTNKSAFLIISINKTGHFMQFSSDTRGVELNFPLITDQQKAMETEFRSVVKDMDLAVIENKGSDGSNFLDIDIDGTTTEVSFIIRQLVEKLFDINKTTKLSFELNA